MSTSTNQIKKMQRLANQMASQHAYMANKYRNRADFVDRSLLLLAFILTLYSVSTYYCDASIRCQPIIEITWAIPLASVVLLSLSFLNYGFNWRARANEHEKATRNLSHHKTQLKEFLREQDADTSQSTFDQLKKIDQFIYDTVPEIPENFFLRTKQHHKNKVLISRIMDRNSAAPIFWIRAILLLRHSIRVFYGRENDDSNSD